MEDAAGTQKRRRGITDPKSGHFYLIREGINSAIALANSDRRKIGGISHFQCIILTLTCEMEIKTIQHKRIRPFSVIRREISIGEVEKMLAKTGLKIEQIFSDNCLLTV